MTISNVLYPVGNVPDAVGFYRDVFAYPPKFLDGTRFAAVDGGAVSLALAASEESVAGSFVAASILVDDVELTLQTVRAYGGQVIRAAEVGPHEIRAVARDPWGNPLVIFQKR